MEEGGGGRVESNLIEGNTKPGVTLRGSCDPTIARNRIAGGRDCGVHALEGATGLIEANEICDNEQACVVVRIR